MTHDEAIDEMVELELTFPIPPFAGDEAVRARETSRRLAELSNFIYSDGPEPKPGWKPSVPSPTGAERERIAQHWDDATIAEMQNMEDWL